MIRLKQVKMIHGRVFLLLEYDGDFSGNRILKVDLDEIKERLKQASAALGRKPTRQDVKDILVSIVNEARKGKRHVEAPLDLGKLIGVDLEAER